MGLWRVQIRIDGWVRHLFRLPHDLHIISGMKSIWRSPDGAEDSTQLFASPIVAAGLCMDHEVRSMTEPDWSLSDEAQVSHPLRETAKVEVANQDVESTPRKGDSPVGSALICWQGSSRDGRRQCLVQVPLSPYLGSQYGSTMFCVTARAKIWMRRSAGRLSRRQGREDADALSKAGIICKQSRVVCCLTNRDIRVRRFVGIQLRRE